MTMEKGRRVAASFFFIHETKLRRSALRLETRSTEDGPTTLRFWSRFEGDLTGVATLGTDSVVERTVTLIRLACRTATFAPLGGLEVPLRVELLFPVSKRERRTAIAASKLLISHTVR